MLATFISLFIFSCAASQDVILKTGEWNEEIKNPGYPSLSPTNYKNVWNIIADQGETIRFQCDDFRLGFTTPEEACNFGKVTIDDGISPPLVKCGSVIELYFESKSNKIKVDLFTDNGGGGYVSCKAKTTSWPTPEEILLDIRDQPAVLRNPETPTPYFDKAWSIKSTTPGSRLSLQCDLSFPEKANCFEDTLHVDVGRGPEKKCFSNKLVLFSQASEMKVRIELNKFGDRNAFCLVQAVNGPNPNQIDNEVSIEEDSSEHGGPEGRVKTTCECGKANKDSQRIFNGTETAVGEYPWMVGLRDKNNWNFCGASIITRFHILTAAHCVLDSKVRDPPVPSELIPVVGAHQRYEDAAHGETQRLTVINVFIPKEYMTFQKEYDIAVLLVADEIKFGKYVGAVCLSPNRMPIINEKIKIMGWGQTETGQSSQVLLKSKARVLSSSICGKPDYHICTQTRKSTTCSGDSGGPLVWLDPETNRYTQVSLVSFGHQDCVSSPAVSTNITFHYEFITKIIQMTRPEVKICKKEE